MLAAAYGLSPGLLAPAYAMDLYMTVMTAPWIPVVLGGLVLPGPIRQSLRSAGRALGPRWRAAVGPVVMHVIFPRDAWQGTQPLLVTGRLHAGTFIYVRYVDPRHVCLGVDVWGVVGTLSEPIETDYYAVHRIEISTGALYPLGNPAVRALPPAERDQLRRQVRVTLDGRVFLDESTRQYETTLSEITVGANHIGGSNAGVRFTGEVLGVQRGPVRP